MQLQTYNTLHVAGNTVTIRQRITNGLGSVRDQEITFPTIDDFRATLELWRLELAWQEKQQRGGR